MTQSYQMSWEKANEKKSEFSFAKSAEQANYYVTEWMIRTFRFQSVLWKHPSPQIPKHKIIQRGNSNYLGPHEQTQLVCCTFFGGEKCTSGADAWPKLSLPLCDTTEL